MIYNEDGQIRLNVVNGNSLVGLYAADGSINVVVNNGSTLKGIQHPSGALNVVVTTDPYDDYYAPNGSMHVIAKGSSYVPLYPTGAAAEANRPNAPVLTLISEIAGLVSLAWDIDDTLAAGDTLTRQVQVSGGDWSSLVDNTSHAITSGEDSANEIAASLNLGNGTWDIRGSVTSATTGKISTWSNILTITISDAVPATALYWGSVDLQWGAGNNITWS